MTSSRERRSRNSLTHEEVLDAAETVAQHGFDALTMRAVATELGASPMSLYRYFPTKEQLVDGLLDRVLARVQRPAATDDWLVDLRAFAYAHALVLAEHPWAITPLFARPDPGVGAALVAEHVFEILARGGVTGADAVAGFSGILALNYGWAAFASPDHSPTQMLHTLEALPPEVFPHSIALAHELSAYAGVDNYERTLELVLKGLVWALPGSNR